MRNRNCFLPLSLSIGILFCTCVHAQLRKIYVNPKNPAVQKQANFIDSIRFIPLEFLKDVNLEGSGVRVTEKYYIVTDYKAKVLYFYTKSGAFVNKINYSEVGTGLYPSYQVNTEQLVFFGDNSNYSLTPKDRIKILLDWDNKRNLKYFRKYVIDLRDTSFAIRKATPGKFDLTNGVPSYNGRYIQTRISTSNLYPDSTGFEMSVYENGKLLKNYFPYNRINEPRFLFEDEEVSVHFSDTPYVSYLTRPFCDTVYRMVKDSLYPAYQLVLPLENSLPARFVNIPFKTKSDKENFERNNGYVFHEITTFYETQRFLYFSISFFQRHDVFVYDKQTGVTYNASKIKADAKQYNQSLLTSLGFHSGNKFYKQLKAETLLSFFKQNPDVAVPKELARLLQSNPDKNTPVVIEYSFKN